MAGFGEPGRVQEWHEAVAQFAREVMPVLAWWVFSLFAGGFPNFRAWEKLAWFS
jgi:hypothetical protein